MFHLLLQGRQVGSARLLLCGGQPQCSRPPLEGGLPLSQRDTPVEPNLTLLTADQWEWSQEARG